jgi:hypothetical protein
VVALPRSPRGLATLHVAWPCTEVAPIDGGRREPGYRTRSGRTTMPFDPDEYELDDDDLPADEDLEPESDDARDDVSEARIGFRAS